MALKIELKPNERLIVNGTAIRNGERKATLVFETHCRFLRESEILLERDADTPCKRLCHLLQVVYLAEEHGEPTAMAEALSAEIGRAAPSLQPFLHEIAGELAAGRHHKAIKAARGLIDHEARLLSEV